MTLLAAPVKRCTVAFTQLLVLISGILLLVLYSTVLEGICAQRAFPGELNGKELLMLNGGLLCIHLFIGGICFLASCVCSDTKYSIGFGAGIPALMYVLQMLANVGGNADKVKYLTFFTLFNPEGIAAKQGDAVCRVAVLFIGAVILYMLGIIVFSRKDLSI